MKTQIVPKGQWVFGGSLTYSTHTNSDYTFLIIEDIESTGYSVKVSPLVGYSLAPNSIIGLRGSYSRSFLNMDSASLHLGEGDAALNFGVDYYYMLKHSYNVAAIWRQYIPLGRNKRLALFAEPMQRVWISRLVPIQVLWHLLPTIWPLSLILACWVLDTLAPSRFTTRLLRDRARQAI